MLRQRVVEAAKDAVWMASVWRETRRPREAVTTDSPLAAHRGAVEAYWRAAGHGDVTVARLTEETIASRADRDVIAMLRRQWGALKGRRVLVVEPVGALAALLSADGAEVTLAVESRAQLDLAKAVAPSVTAVEMVAGKLAGVAGGPFDHVVLQGVLERVGSPRAYHGSAAPALDVKRALVRDAAALLGPQGSLFIRTPNFQFPLDAMTGTWLFHWLPPAAQQRFLTETHETCDPYSLMTWDELTRAAEGAGLQVERTETAGLDELEQLVRVFQGAVARTSGRMPLHLASQVVGLMRTEPRFMPVFHVFLRHAPAAPTKSTRASTLRTVG